ncbi:hypothetical protein Adeh_3619 [Anaeromyxobacter dehalogenans 2CP-C]|uniref:Uncharacterized protein n=1 Tax=Anaeromyxobacter dehalogenans (strain 2CP-C) TaxID=290397 RepID=Q2IFM6_ANADE|nr:hypothetical protein Adeh_3619 [Anaeromyxobacter dehalogenans 2CP-C]
MRILTRRLEASQPDDASSRPAERSSPAGRPAPRPGLRLHRRRDGAPSQLREQPGHPDRDDDEEGRDGERTRHRRVMPALLARGRQRLHAVAVAVRAGGEILPLAVASRVRGPEVVQAIRAAVRSGAGRKGAQARWGKGQNDGGAS